MIQPHRKMFCHSSGVVVCGNFLAAFAVLKCMTSNFGSIGVDVETIPFQIF